MPHSVIMPALEMGQETGKLVSWLKKDGDTVRKGEPLLEVETDKAVLEVEAPAEGTLAGLTANEGDVIPVGQNIAWILSAGEELPGTPPPVSPASAAAVPVSAPSEPHNGSLAASSPSAASSPASSNAKISPKAARLARENGIDIATIRGSGAAGEISASDVEAAIRAKDSAPLAPPARKTRIPSTTVGRIMAERTLLSWTTVPHFFLSREVEAAPLVEARERRKQGKPPAVKVTHTDLLVALTARVLAKHPRMNASWSPEGIELNEKVNVAIAIAVEDGVVSAVIPNADALPLSEISVLRRDLAERAKTRNLRPSDIAGATFTISNLGMYDVDSFQAIIIPPQAGILAVGRIRDRAVPVDGKPEIRPVMNVTLSGDHRVLDGAQAASFLKDLVSAFAGPEPWLS